MSQWPWKLRIAGPRLFFFNLCMYMGVLPACMSVPKKKATESWDYRIMSDTCQLHAGKLNSGPPEEQPVLLTTAPSLAPGNLPCSSYRNDYSSKKRYAQINLSSEFSVEEQFWHDAVGDKQGSADSLLKARCVQRGKEQEAWEHTGLCAHA